MSQETAFFLHAKMRLNPSESTGDVMAKVIVLMVLMNLLAMMNAKSMLGSAPTVLNVSWQKRNVMELGIVQTILMKCYAQENANVKLGSVQIPHNASVSHYSAMARKTVKMVLMKSSVPFVEKEKLSVLTTQNAFQQDGYLIEL